MAKADKTLSAAEKQAVKDRAKELRASQKKEKLEQAVLEKIAAMTEDEQAIARRVHAMVKELAPDLTAKTMYGMPAYADADGRTVVMFQAASKFGPLLDDHLRRGGRPRRRHHVADLLGPHHPHRRRRREAQGAAHPGRRLSPRGRTGAGLPWSR